MRQPSGRCLNETCTISALTQAQGADGSYYKSNGAAVTHTCSFQVVSAAESARLFGENSTITAVLYLPGTVSVTTGQRVTHDSQQYRVKAEAIDPATRGSLTVVGLEVVK